MNQISPHRALTLAARALEDSNRVGPRAGLSQDFCAELLQARDHILALRDHSGASGRVPLSAGQGEGSSPSAHTLRQPTSNP